MTPQERTRLEELEKLVQSLQRVENVSFVENMKRRGSDTVRSDGTAAATSMLKAVNEGGASSYNVTTAPDVKLKVILVTGETYYLPAFNS